MSRFKLVLLASLMFPWLIGNSAHAGETAPQQSPAPLFSDPYAAPAGAPSAPAAKKSPAKPSGKETRSATVKKQEPVGKVGLENSPSLVTNAALPDLKPNASPSKGKAAADELPLGLGLHWSAANDPHLNPLSTTEAIDSVRRNQGQTPSSPGNELDLGMKLNF
ncbi:MAG: hypothetical protein WDN46_20290 [Methylocella sp.]